MKRIGATVLALLCLLWFFGGCAGVRNDLKVGFETDFQPFGYQEEDGSYVGFDIELAREVCRMESWTFRPVPINWDEKDILLNSEEIDCIWNGFTITGREDSYTVSIPYGVDHQSVAVRADSDICTLDDLQGKVVGVQAASSISEYLLNDPEGIEMANGFGLLAQFADFSTAYGALNDGTLDAAITDATIMELHVEKSGGSLRSLEETLLDEQYGVAFRKGDLSLCEIVNKDLKKLAQDGTVDRLAEKYGLSEFIHVDVDEGP